MISKMKKQQEYRLKADKHAKEENENKRFMH